MGDHCNLPGCVGEPPVCAKPGCDIHHPNACSADPAYKDWRCKRHRAERDVVLADQLAEALRPLLADTEKSHGDGEEGSYCASGVHCSGCGLDLPCGCEIDRARAALRRYDEARRGAMNHAARKTESAGAVEQK